MKNLLNCHSVGLHSFPVSFENNLYKRIFYADCNHNLWKEDPLELAIHPHHVDIKIKVLEGTMYNCTYEKSGNGINFKSFKWSSVILNGSGGFVCNGNEKLRLISKMPYIAGDGLFMKTCELHTVFVNKGEKAVWLIEEEIPTCAYFPINYSNWDLTKWSASGLYKEVSDEVKIKYIEKYL